MRECIELLALPSITVLMEGEHVRNYYGPSGAGVAWRSEVLLKHRQGR